jgi:hypothetical protein
LAASHPPEAFVGFGHEAAHLVVRRRIERSCQHFHAGLGRDFLGGLVQGGLSARAQGQPGAFPRQPKSHRFPQAPAGSGHDGYSIFQSQIHDYLPRK